MKHKFSLNNFRMLSVFVILALVSGCANASPAIAAAPYTLIDLGTLGGSTSIATDINQAGQAVGYSYLAGDIKLHPFVWEGGVMTDLGTLGGNHSQALAINEAGQVVGYSGLVGDAADHAFVWDGGVMTDLGTLGGSASVAVDINEAGQVVGYS
jgi:probable HAF family extracellular repeat protein